MKKLVLAVVVLAVVGGTGWYVYQNNKNKPDASNNSQQSQNSQSNNTNDQSEDIKYLTIEQYRVRIPLNDQTSELKLGAIKYLNDSESDKYINIFAPSLNDTWECSSVGDDDRPGIGSISITLNEKRGGPYEPLVTKKIGNNTYGFESGGANCTDSPRYTTLVETFKNQFQKMESY